MSEQLYPELPWTDEDEAAADRALAKQIAEGDTGPHLTAEEAQAMDERLQRETVEAERLKQDDDGEVTA